MEQLKIIKTLSGIEELKVYLQDKELIAVDSETVGTDKDAKIIGFSICTDIEVGYYVMLSYWDVEKQALIHLETTTGAKSLLETLIDKSLIMHNAVFDCFMFQNNFSVNLLPSVHTDTMILSHLLDENRHNGLKELGVSLFGDDARAEQIEMKESVYRNGGVLTKENYELYKADGDLMAKYGAKDAILTLKVFYELIPPLYEQGLEDFFYKDESMPLLKGPTYELNTVGLRVDADKLQNLKGTLEAECLEAKAFIQKEIYPYVKDKYPGDKKTNHFNIGATQQLTWLLFEKLQNDFSTLTKGGKELCRALEVKLPYSNAAKREFIQICKDNKGRVYMEAKWNPKTKKMERPKKVGDYWKYLAFGKESAAKLALKYKWVDKLLEYKKNLKLLNTYVEGIQSKMRYNVIRPSFLQHGTTSGRYSSRHPNFQNLPRDDKRIKGCIIARPGKVFVGADYSQLEPRVFASFSEDIRLLNCFKTGDDFYSVIGSEVFNKTDCSLKKDDENSFAKKYKSLRDLSKTIALSVTYGTTAPKLSVATGKSIEECENIINNYFDTFPSVLKLMLESHEVAKTTGEVKNLFGRPRRIPKALEIKQVCGNSSHDKLPYEYRNLLNLAINHRIQSTGASIMNRAAIRLAEIRNKLRETDKLWSEVFIVLQVHDELVLEGPEELSESMVLVLKESMEESVKLPQVDLVAEPKVAKNLAELK